MTQYIHQDDVEAIRRKVLRAVCRHADDAVEATVPGLAGKDEAETRNAWQSASSRYLMKLERQAL